LSYGQVLKLVPYEYQEYYLITNGFLDQTDLNTEELEDKIWLNANSWISKTKLHDKVGGDKKTCFDRIKIMIPMQLKEKTEKNRILVCRIDTTNRAEFENTLVFQENMLSLMRDELNKYPKPMFYEGNSIVHYIPALTKQNIKEFRKAYKKKYEESKRIQA